LKKIVSPQTLLAQEAPSRARQIVRTNDVLVATTRPNLNAVALVPPELNGQICSTGFCVLRASTEVPARLIFAYVQSPLFVSTVSQMVQGALYPAITDDDVRDCWIPLPPLTEQRAIVARLEAQMAQVQRLRAAAERQLEAARAMQGAILRQVFRYKEGEPLPPGWRWVRLGEICSRLQYGFTAAAQAEPVGPKMLRITDIENGEINWNKVPYCICPAETAQQYSLQALDILFARTGSVGKSYLVTNPPTNTIFASYLIRVQVKPEVIPSYLYAYLQSPEYWKQVRQKTYGGVQPNMSASVLATIDVPLPPLNEQRAIVARLEAQMAQVQRLRAAAERQLEAINALPGALLNEIFGGFEPPAEME